jgi:type II secretory pathway pseudopilin PulG
MAEENPMKLENHRNGFALPAALLAMVIVGALVTGGVYAAMQQDRTSANAHHGQAAFMAAERGLDDILGTRTRPYFESIGPVGTVDVIGPVAVSFDDIDAQYTVYVRRLNTRLFAVESEGEVTSGGRYAGSKRRVGEIVRVAYTYYPVDRTITTHVPLRMRGQSAIRGLDSIPTGWVDCSDVGEKTGILAKDQSTIDIVTAGGKAPTGAFGDPPIGEDVTLDYDSFIEYGDMNLLELIGMADKHYAPGTYNGFAPISSGGVCDKTIMNNWGDPNNPAGACHYYWPIIHSPGDLSIQNGVGQGILIVEGDLRITGNLEFIGMVFVFGALRTSGTGNKIVGTASVLGQSALETELQTDATGSTQMQLSSCAIDRAHRYNDRFARPIPLAERRFVDISSLGLD